MHRILANRSVMVAVLAVALAGDVVRHSVGVIPWIVLLGLGTVWGVLVLASTRLSWRDFPLPLLALLAWWGISPIWSPYPLTSLAMLVAVGIALVVGGAMVTAAPLTLFVDRVAEALRIILAASIAFEIGVALHGSPIYPVGYAVTTETPIEAAWSRGEFFDPSARIQGIVGNANVLAMLALVAFIVAAWRARASRSWRTVSSLDALLAGFIIIRTASATVTVTALGVAVIIALTALARRPGRGARLTLIAALLAIGGGIAMALGNWPHVAAFLGKSPDLTHRFDIWAAVLERANQRPVTGSGFVGWWPNWDSWFDIAMTNGLPVAQAHNLWVDLYLQTGIIGVAIFAITLASILIPLWRGFRRDARSVIAVPFLIVSALTIQSLTESRLLHEWGLMVLFAFALVAHRTGRELSAAR